MWAKQGQARVGLGFYPLPNLRLALRPAPTRTTAHALSPVARTHGPCTRCPPSLHVGPARATSPGSPRASERASVASESRTPFLAPASASTPRASSGGRTDGRAGGQRWTDLSSFSGPPRAATCFLYFPSFHAAASACLPCSLLHIHGPVRAFPAFGFSFPLLPSLPPPSLSSCDFIASPFERQLH